VELSVWPPDTTARRRCTGTQHAATGASGAAPLSHTHVDDGDALADAAAEGAAVWEAATEGAPDRVADAEGCSGAAAETETLGLALGLALVDELRERLAVRSGERVRERLRVEDCEREWERVPVCVRLGVRLRLGVTERV